jgi:hypothetical protein
MCGIELASDLDAFGDVGEELCQSCFLELTEMGQTEYSIWYGMAPHEHVPLINQTGKKVGHITRLLDYSDKPQRDGWYEIEPGLWFSPDAEVDGGQGIWEDRRGE